MKKPTTVEGMLENIWRMERGSGGHPRVSLERSATGWAAMLEDESGSMLEECHATPMEALGTLWKRMDDAVWSLKEPLFSGSTPFTTVDFPGRLASVWYVPGCPMRCPYCHNSDVADGSLAATVTYGEFMEFMENRRGKLDGVVLSGGDPCVLGVEKLSRIIEYADRAGYAVKLDTSGLLFPVEDIPKARLLKGLAIDIKGDADWYGRYAAVRGDRSLLEFFQRNLRTNIAYMASRTDIYREFRTTVHPAVLSKDDVRGLRKCWGLPEDIPWYLQQYNPVRGFDAGLKGVAAYGDDELRALAEEVGAKFRKGGVE